MTTIFCSKGHENPGTNVFCQVCGEKLPLPVVNSLIPGAILEGRYRLIQQIGQGGFGRTYLCEDLNRFHEPCVLKEFAPQVQGTSALDKAKNLFAREASVLYQLQHPQIPKFRELFQMTTGNGGLFLVQDFVAGQTYRYALNSRLQQDQTFTEEEVRQLLLKLLPVLEYTHSLGVIHRDIAPDNLILRASDGLPVLIDFGGVKQIAVNAEIQARGNTDTLTRLGKVGYAPHEQMQRGTVFPHSDLYALAATSLVLLTGQEPMELIDPRTMTWQWHQFVQLQPDLAAVLDRMLQSRPAERIQSATAVLQALQHHQPVPPVVIPHPSTAGTVVVAPQHRSGAVASSQLAKTNNAFLEILSRTWIGLLGIAAAVGLGWGATSMLKKPEISPIVTPESNPQLETSPSPAVSEPAIERTSPSPSVENRESPAATTIRPRRPRPRRLNSGNASPTVSTPPSAVQPEVRPSIASPSPPASLTPLPSNPPRTRIEKYRSEEQKPPGDSFEASPEPTTAPMKPSPSVVPEPKQIVPEPSNSETDPLESPPAKPQVTPLF